MMEKILELLGKVQKNMETLTELFARFRLRLDFDQLMTLKGLTKHDIQELASISSATVKTFQVKNAYVKRISWSFNGPVDIKVDYADCRKTYYATMTGSHDVEIKLSGQVRVTATPSGTATGNIDVFSYDLSQANQTLEDMLR